MRGRENAIQQQIAEFAEFGFRIRRVQFRVG
jgi:hypothetical protein